MTHHLCLVLTCFAVVLHSDALGHAAPSQQLADDLTKLTRESRTDQVLISGDQLSRLRTDLRVQAQNLVKTLDVYGPKFASQWKRYLKWDFLKPQLSDDAPIDRRALKHLDQVLKRFRANQPGLELPQFVQTAKAIERFRAFSPWTVTTKPQQEYERLLINLEEQLRRHEQAPTSETSWKIARILGLTYPIDQSRPLNVAIREQLARKNILAEVSNQFINRAAQRPVDSTQPVTDYILGTRIHGTARTLGTLNVRTVPAEDEAQLDLQLTGNSYSSTWGHQHPVRIRSTGRTNFFANARIFLSAESFCSQPAVVDAKTKTSILSICKTGGRFGHRLVERIAWKKACKNKRCAEQIASSHAEPKIASRFDQQLVEALGRARQNFEKKVRDPLVRRAVYPDRFLMATTTDSLRVETVFAKQNQLASESSPPPMKFGSDITLQIHQSAVNNYIPLAMSGVTIQQLTEDQEPQLIGEVPAWMSKFSLGKDSQKHGILRNRPTEKSALDESNKKNPPVADGSEPQRDRPDFIPWSITLSDEQPVSVGFNNQQLSIRMRASMLKSDEDEYKHWDFIVTYNLLHQNNDILLRRSGEIEVFPTGFDPRWDKKMSTRQSGFRNTLANNMNARANRGDGFPAEIPIQAIRLPEQLGIPGELKLRQLDCNAGWLTIGWALP